MSDLLAEMARSSRARAEGLDVAALREVPASPRALVLPEFTLVAEVKFRAPSAGVLAPPGDVLERVGAYVDAGAAAVSVLTEPSRFDGQLAYLRAASDHALTMRKDFLVAPEQVWEARAHGASGVLLIARMLDDAALDAMLRAAEAAGLFVLLEAFDAADLARCDVSWTSHQPLLVGVNCRDLRTLAVDPDRFRSLAPLLPKGRVAIAESGLETPEDAARVAEWGYGGALVGTALMRAADPGALVRAMLRAGGGR
ncbi:MAG: indole-3-glycerol-phosphate synthase [Alphaproteobacteria bacterium]|nr:indole-3-glycerol-phosphate synthase [Alphaproteobacteria bacterium]